MCSINTKVLLVLVCTHIHTHTPFICQNQTVASYCHKSCQLTSDSNLFYIPLLIFLFISHEQKTWTELRSERSHRPHGQNAPEHRARSRKWLFHVTSKELTNRKQKITRRRRIVWNCGNSVPKPTPVTGVRDKIWAVMKGSIMTWFHTLKWLGVLWLCNARVCARVC